MGLRMNDLLTLGLFNCDLKWHFQECGDTHSLTSMNLHDIFPSSPAPPQSYPGVDPGFVGPRAYSTWGPHVLKNNTEVQNEGKSEYYVELIKKS